MRTRLIAFILALLLACVARAEFTVYHATWRDPASTQPAPDVPAGVAPCFWTAGNILVWPDPPTSAQVRAVAELSTNGGPSPYAKLEPAAWGGTTYPPGALVLLDGEGRTDERVDEFLNLYNYWLPRVKRPDQARPLYAVYAFYPASYRDELGYGSFPSKAANHIAMTRGAEARAARTARIAAKVPVLVLEVYPNRPQDDETVYSGWEFDVVAARRLFPTKRLFAITRGDRGAAGGGRLTAPETMRLALFLRSRFDGCIAWGSRENNVDLMKTLTDLR